MPSRGEIFHPRTESDQITIKSMSISAFLRDLGMTDKVIKGFTTTIRPVIKHIKEMSVNMPEDVILTRFRGSSVPSAFADKDSGIGALTCDNKLTNTISTLLNDFPTVAKKLGISPLMFMKNADLNIEVLTESKLNELLEYLKEITDFKIIKPRDNILLYQLISDKYPLININLIKISADSDSFLSLYSEVVDDDLIQHVHKGSLPNLRFAVSKIYDAASGDVELDSQGQVIVNLSKANQDAIFGSKPDVFFAEPYKDFGQIISDVARWVRFLGTTFGIDTLKAALNEENINAINESINKDIDNDIDGITNQYYRDTFISSMIYLLFSNHEAFGLVVKRLPRIFAASRNFKPSRLPDLIKYKANLNQKNITMSFLKSLYRLFTMLDTQDNKTKKPHNLNIDILDISGPIPIG